LSVNLSDGLKTLSCFSLPQRSSEHDVPTYAYPHAEPAPFFAGVV